MPCGRGVKAGMVRVKLCDALVTHGPYLSALEIGHNKALYKFTFTFFLVEGHTTLVNLQEDPISIG